VCACVCGIIFRFDWHCLWCAASCDSMINEIDSTAHCNKRRTIQRYCTDHVRVKNLVQTKRCTPSSVPVTVIEFYEE
jgi:hypothetical protein